MINNKEKETLKLMIINEFKSTSSLIHIFMRNWLGETTKGLYVPDRKLYSKLLRCDIFVHTRVSKDNNTCFDVQFEDAEGRSEEEWEDYETRVFDVTEPAQDYCRYREDIYIDNTSVVITITEFEINDFMSSNVLRTLELSVDMNSGETKYIDGSIQYGKEAQKAFLDECEDIIPEPFIYYPFRIDKIKRRNFETILIDNGIDYDKTKKILKIISQDHEAKDGIPLMYMAKALFKLVKQKETH